MSKKEGCDCQKCRECCRREAGWFLPDEIGFAAVYLGLTEKEFTEKYLEEHEQDGVLTLAPRMTKSGCIFLKNGLCSIHPVKPYECRKVYGCQPERRHKRIRESIIKRWR